MASNGVTNESIKRKAKQAIVYSLCKRLSLDPQSFSNEGIVANDIKTLYSDISKLTGAGSPLKTDEEVMKWVGFADSFPVDLGARLGVLKGLNVELNQKAVLLGYGFKPSEADIVVFSILHSFVSDLSSTERQKYPNVLRWVDYIQSKEDFGDIFEKIQVEKTVFEPQVSKNVGKVDSDLNSRKGVQNIKTADKAEADSNSKKSENLAADPETKKSVKSEADLKTKKSATEKKVPGDSKATDEKKKTSEKESVDKDTETSVSLLNIQVGLIRKAWKHPSADSLLVEEIDVGEGTVRQVVSGLAKFCSPEELTNRRVVLITNVKPGKLRDVMSAGLVLCASNQDHTLVEPLLPPEGAKIGERVSFSGHDGKPEDVLNPKKKQLDKITPHLCTDDKGVATFKGIPFMTSAGPCTSSVPNASVK
ncbi:tRNA-binding domain [Macleaya cordata]|uniref:tRNA-binding domain n=1 Tax=Macleaya cordata TaxID=56857 RepID=A0A200Q6E8_MACCD|nr:tRNA-binding domain [Macleaya cordata]